MAAVAGAVFLFACGSSSVPELHRIGGPGRWVALFGVLAVAVSAARGRPRIVISPVVLAVAGLCLDAVASTSWSVAWDTTGPRAGALCLVVATAFALASLAASRETTAEAVLRGVVAGAVVVALAGVVVWLLDPSAAVRRLNVVSRFQGMTENPNTGAILCALALPVAVVLAPRLARGVAAAAFVTLAAVLIASGSRAAQVGAAAGVVVAATALGRRGKALTAALLVAGIAAAAVVGVGQTRDRAETIASPSPATSAAPAPKLPPGIRNPGPLGQEIGTRDVNRGVLRSSGRLEAWRGAMRQANERPVLGYGFGTERRVFVDRYSAFQGDYVENSWLGLYLQLGALGLLLLAVVVVGLLASAVRAVRTSAAAVDVGCAAAMVAAVPLTVAFSWIYSAGNVGAFPFWVMALLFAARVGRSARLAVGRPAALGLAAAVAAAALVPLGRWEGRRAVDEQLDGIARVQTLVGFDAERSKPAAWRIAAFADCLLFRRNGNPFALELCFDASGRLIEAIDRRSGSARFWSIRPEPGAATSVEAPQRLFRLLRALGAFPPALVYPDRLPLQPDVPGLDTGEFRDTGPVLVTGSARPAS